MSIELLTPRVLVDADGVLFQWDALFTERMLRADPEYPFKKVGDRLEYNVLGGPEDPWARHVLPVMRAAGFYRELVPYEGARAALEGMQAAGWDVWICTTNDINNPTGADDKLHSIREHFGDYWVSRTILTQDKTLVDADVLIDDKPVIRGVSTPSWEHVLFDQSYNRHIDRVRLTGWSEWEQLKFFYLVGGELTVIKEARSQVEEQVAA